MQIGCMPYIYVCFSIPDKDYAYLMAPLVTERTIERLTVVLSLWIWTLFFNNSIAREVIDLYHSVRGVSIKPTSHRFEFVGPMLSTTGCSNYFKLRDILCRTAMRDLNRDWLSDGALGLTAHPIHGTD